MASLFNEKTNAIFGLLLVSLIGLMSFSVIDHSFRGMNNDDEGKFLSSFDSDKIDEYFSNFDGDSNPVVDTNSEQFDIKSNIVDVETGLQNFLQSSISEHWPIIIEDTFNRIWIAYVNFTGSDWYSTDDSDIYARHTSDKGVTWSEPFPLLQRAGKDGPFSITIDGNGTMWLFWRSDYTNGVNYDIWARNSTNNGLTWSTPFMITNTPTAKNSGPTSFYSPNGTLWVIYNNKPAAEDQPYYVTSPDNGKTWSTPKELPLNSGNARLLCASSSTVTQNGTLVIYFQELSSLWAAFVYRSPDNGQTWTKHQATPYENRHQGDVYVDSNFTIFVIDTLVSDGELYTVNSTDGGSTWTSRMKISTSGGISPSTLIDREGNLWITFSSTRDGDYDLYYNIYEDYDPPPYIFYKDQWGTSGTSNGQFDFPVGVETNSTGCVYVVDMNNNRIQVFNASGNFINTWGSFGTGDGQFNNPRGIAINSTGYVYVADSENHRIQLFDSSGVFINKWGVSGTGDGQFSNPEALAVNTSGFVYVMDTGNNRIQVFDASGGFITKWGSSGSSDGQFNYPTGGGISSIGWVYIADVDNHRVQVFDASGNFITKWGNFGTGDGQFNKPYSLCLDQQDNVYVTEMFNYRISVFEPLGNFIINWGSIGTGDGEFNEPRAITIGSDNLIFVADRQNNRIQVFKETTGFFEPESPSFLTYYDDFNDGDISDWYINSGDWYVYNGMLRTNNTVTGESRHLIAPITAIGDWEVSVDVYWASGSYFEGMVLFDANFSTIPQRFWSIFMSTYAGNVYKGVYYELNPFSADTKAENITTVSTDNWYKFTAKRVGTTLFFYLNDNLMHTEYNAIDPGMEFALSSASSNPEVIYFDNFTVSYYESGGNPFPIIDSPVDVNYEEGQTGYSITWTPSDTDPASYNVTRDGVLIKSGTWNSSGETITVSVDGLTEGSYVYRCNVYDTVNQSAFDEVLVTVTIPPNTPPTIDDPADVSFTEGETGYSITWIASDVDPNPLSYNITKDGSLYQEGLWNTSGETITILLDGLTDGTYVYRCNIYDIRNASATDEVIVIVAEFGTPTITSPPDISYMEGETGYVISWIATDSDPDPSSYNITLDGLVIEQGTWNSSGETISISVDGLLAGNYFYKCNIYDLADHFTFDEVNVFVIVDPVPIIDHPNDIEYDENDTGYFLIWNPTDTNPSFYNVTRDGTLIQEGPWNASGETITISVDGLPNGTYFYRCNVYDDRGQTAFDEAIIRVNKKVIDKPSPPRNLVGSVTSGQVVLNWIVPLDDGGTDITGYNIYRSTDGQHYTLISSSASTSFNDITAGIGLTYYYVVTAVNIIGESEFSNSVEVRIEQETTSTTTTAITAEITGDLSVYSLISNILAICFLIYSGRKKKWRSRR